MAQEQTLPERFLNVFQGDIRNNVIAFSRRLWERDSDVFLFMARKAACFFDCLRELKLADVRGVALSDRVLDMDLSFLRGKRVTLVDDCVFTGTTLYNARNAVLQAGCSDFDTMALAVNMDSMRPNLLPGGDEADDLRIAQPIYGLSDSDCVRQCYDIVRAVSLIPRPYDVDFPHSRTIKLKDDVLDVLLHLPGWTAYDATSDFQKANQVRAFSLLPMPPVHSAFCDLHSGDIIRLPSAKLRVYARQTASTSWTVRLVPIVMFPAIDDDQVTKTLRDAASQSLDIVSVCGLSTPQARYRMLHFLLAHSLLDFFSGIAAAPLSLTLPTEIRHDLMEMSFGIGAWQRYEECWPNRDRIALPPVHVGTVSSHTATFDGTPTTVDDPGATVSESLAPFTWLLIRRWKRLATFRPSGYGVAWEARGRAALLRRPWMRLTTFNPTT